MENKCSAILIAKTITKRKTCKRTRRRGRRIDSGCKEQRDVAESCAKNTKRKRQQPMDSGTPCAKEIDGV